MGELKIGRGTEEDVKVGPLIDQPSREKVEELVEDALEQGRDVLVGGEIARRRAATSTSRRCWATSGPTPAC